MNEPPFLPFARPCLDEATYKEVDAVLRSGWLTTGPKTAQFEQALADYFGRQARCLSSATAGLQLALLALRVGPGDEVITTPLTFAATLNIIVQAGARPVLVDIDPATRNMDVNLVRQAITPRTRVLMPVHFAGLPVDLDPLYALAQEHGLRVVEDCAHAIGAEYKGRRLGSFGDIQVMSFHPNKNITTGEGGCLVTDDADVLKAVERLRFHGIEREGAGTQHYDVVLPGFKYNMMDIQAAIGLHQLPKLDGFIEARARRAAQYRAQLASLPLGLPEKPDYSHLHAWHLFTVLAEGRDAFMEGLKARGIGAGLHYTPAHLFSFYREMYGYKKGDFPHAEHVGARICSLPLFPQMTDGDLDRVVKAVQELLA